MWSHDDLGQDRSRVVDPYHTEQGQGQGQKKGKSKVYQTFYVVSPSDIVASLPRMAEDHIKWLWEKEEYEAAWRQAIECEEELAMARSKLNATSLGEELLKFVLEEGDAAQRARLKDLLAEVCLKSKARWEKRIGLLSDKGKLVQVMAASRHIVSHL